MKVYEQVAALADGSKSVQEIADVLGKSHGSVQSHLRYARDKGHICLLSTTRRRGFTSFKGYMRLGSFGAMIKSLPPEVREWLSSQLVPGTALAHIVSGIILDTYLDEKENK